MPADLLTQTLWATAHGATALPYDLPRFGFSPPADLRPVAIKLALRALGPATDARSSTQ